MKDAVARGAVQRAGGQVDGTILAATVLDNLTPAMSLYHEESFGPVVAVVRVATVDDAVRVANDTEYGLSSAVFGRDVVRAFAVARRIETGICHVNSATAHDEPQMLFFAMNASGFGGKAAIDEFTELRWFTVSTAPRLYPF